MVSVAAQIANIEGITALYGPYATFEETTDTRGGVPLEVCFDLTSNSAITETEWNYGDGQSDVECEPCALPPGVCRDIPQPTTCQSDADCGADQYCEIAYYPGGCACPFVDENGDALSDAERLPDAAVCLP